MATTYMVDLLLKIQDHMLPDTEVHLPAVLTQRHSLENLLLFPKGLPIFTNPVSTVLSF